MTKRVWCGQWAEWASQGPRAGGNWEEELSGALFPCSMNSRPLFCLSFFYFIPFYQLLFWFVCFKFCVWLIFSASSTTTFLCVDLLLTEWFQLLRNVCSGASEMARQVKALAPKADSLNSISSIHGGRRELTSLLILWPLCMPTHRHSTHTHMHSHTHALTHTLNEWMNKWIKYNKNLLKKKFSL